MKTRSAGKTLAAFILFLSVAAFAADRDIKVSACKRPGGKLTQQPTRTVAGLAGYAKPLPVMPLDSYGGDPARRAGAPGFFRTVKSENRWWLVDPDRGLFYQNFTLGLLESGVCVGWHWFKYMDNDPSDRSADPSNRDSNKGIVTSQYVEYAPLLDRMAELNTQVYDLADYFDRK